VNPITKIPLAVQEGTEEDEFINLEEQTSVTMTKMPDPYARDAPKFHYDRPEELNRFIKRVEELFKSNQIDDDREKIRYLGSYTEGTFADFKKEIIESYPEASNPTWGSIKELKRICDK